MDQENDKATVVVIDSACCLLAVDMDADTATTLIALVSDDPSSWEETISLWPRYHTPVVCEFSSSLPLSETNRDDAMRALEEAEAWVVIDFLSKRVFIGGSFMEAEIVTDLENADAAHDEIKSLNQAFADYRRSDDVQRPQLVSELKANLQTLADRYPDLVSKSADLQSRIDESERSAKIDDSDAS